MGQTKMINKEKRKDICFNVYLKKYDELIHDINDKNGLSTLKNPIFLNKIKQTIWYGIVGYPALFQYKEKETLTRTEVETMYVVGQQILSLIEYIRPKDFISIFPIKKDYNGEKLQSKDYFYVNQLLTERNIYFPIKMTWENGFSFLWDYNNDDILIFLLKVIKSISNLRVINGEKDLMVEFCEKNNITTYRKFVNPKGKEYLVNQQTGKHIRIKKSFPRYLKILR